MQSSKSPDDLKSIDHPDPYTDHVINSMSKDTDPRTKILFSSLVKHLHHFAREVDLTTEEWFQSCEFINQVGQISSGKRNEAILVSDILGLESLVDELAHERAKKLGIPDNQDNEPTYSAILGPFWRDGAPEVPIDGDIVTQHFEEEEPTYFHGHVTGSNGRPLKGVEVDVWHTGPDGLYDSQNEQGPDFNMRGRIYTDDRGFYGFYCLKPVPYPIPHDGPAGKMLAALGRHPMRPAHIHLMVKKDGYKPLITQVFDEAGPYLKDDAVFAVKDSLIIKFEPTSTREKAKFEVRYDIQLVPNTTTVSASL